MIKEFKEKKQILLNLYDKLLEYKFIPFQNDGIIYDKSAMEKDKENLENETFYISVCGAIKAGKSTLINKWIFDGRNILPTDDGVCTATLSKIQYSEEEYAKVYFHNEEEWNKLKESKIPDENNIGKENSYYEKYLKPELEISAKQGIYKEQVIQNEQLIKKIKISELEQYTAKSGKFAPFVRNVDILINNKDIQDTIIVDTPGTNDPNLIRGNIAKKWISHSSAVIMLMYAGQALGKGDLNFIDKYLASIPSDKILFALSKPDLVGDIDYVKDYVENQLRINPNIKDRNLLKNDKQVYPISAKASIIKSKREKNIKLTPDEETLIDNADDIEDYINNDGYLKPFFDAVDKYLMRDKGYAILQKAKKQIKSICQNKINEFNKEIELNEFKYKLDTTEVEIKKKRDELKRIRGEIRNNQSKYKNIFENEKIDLRNKIRKEIREIIINIETEMDRWINSEKNIDEIIKLAVFKLKESFESNFLDKFDNLNDTGKFDSLEEILKDYKRSIKNITKSVISSRMDYIFHSQLDLNNIFSKEKKEIEEKLSSDALEGLRVKFIFWTKKERTKIEIRATIKNLMPNVSKDLYYIMNNKITYDFDRNITKIDNNVENILSDIDDSLKDIEKDAEKRKKNKEEIKRIIDDLIKRKKNFEYNFSRINKELDSV